MLAAFYSPWAWLILIAIIVILFGGKRLVGAGRGLGTGIREFKDSIKGGDDGPEELPAPRPARVDRDEI